MIWKGEKVKVDTWEHLRAVLSGARCEVCGVLGGGPRPSMVDCFLERCGAVERTAYLYRVNLKYNPDREVLVCARCRSAPPGVAVLRGGEHCG